MNQPFVLTYPNFPINTDGVCAQSPLPEKLPAINADFMTAYNFLNGNARLRNISRFKLGSYRFKHILEEELPNIYISNGQLILIMSTLGFKCRPDYTSPNCLFNCNFK